MVEYTDVANTGIAWLPQIPQHWKVRKLKYAFDERSDKGYPNEPLLVSSQNMGVVLKSVYGKRTVEALKDLDKLKLVKVGDYVVSLRSFQGGIEYAYYQGIISPAYTIMEPHKDCKSDYYKFLLKSAPFIKLLTTCVTGIREGQNVDYKKLRNVEIPIPPRAEQDQIVRFLDWKVSKINKKVALKRRSLDLIKELINSAFAALVENKAEIVRLKRVVSLENDYIEINPDESYRKAGMYNRGRGIFLRDAVSGKEMGDSKFQRIHSGRLMLSGQFAWEDAVFVTSFKDEEGVASHRYYLLKSENKDVPVEYLFGYFISQKGFTDLQQCSHGSAGRNRPLNINELLRIEIPIVHNPESIRKLCNLVQVYMTMRPLVLHEEEILDELRNRIISDVVTGKIDVRNVTIPEYEHIDDIYDDNNEDSEETDETETDGEEA